MQWLKIVFFRTLDWCRWACGIVPKSAIGSPNSYLYVHYIVMALIAIALGYPGISDWIRGALGLPLTNETLARLGLRLVDRCWCGVLFVLSYCIARLVLYLLSILGLEEESEFQDIEGDWQEILEALNREHLQIDDEPLFLINGLTPQQQISAFEAAYEDVGEATWSVIAPPVTRTNAVLRMFGRKGALFLCLSGVGATSRQQGNIAPAAVSRAPMGTAVGNRSGTAGGTMHAGSMAAPPKTATGTMTAAPQNDPPPQARTAAAPIARFMGTMMPGSLRKAMQTLSVADHSSLKGYGKQKVSPLESLKVELEMRRIDLLCHLIKRSRTPLVGINGMLQAIPLSWTHDTDEVRRLCPAVRKDLQRLHDGLHLQFPVVAMITELDDVAGVKEFLLRSERLAPGLRWSRAGSSFPAGAEISERNAEWIVDAAMRWFRGWVFNAFAHDINSRDNTKLFQMVCELGQRRAGLILFLQEIFYRTVNPTVRLHGVYFSATGKSSTEQGFIRGVLDKLTQFEEEVAWNPGFVAEIQQSKLLSGLLFGGAAAAFAAAVFILSQIPKM